MSREVELVMSTDWEHDTGLPWPHLPLGSPYYGQHHYRDGQRVVDPDGPFRHRDRVARLLGYHCWECWWT